MTDTAMVAESRHRHERLRTTQQAKQNADGIAEERGVGIADAQQTDIAPSRTRCQMVEDLRF